MRRMGTRPQARVVLALLAGVFPAGCEIAQITVEQPEARVVAEIYLRVTNDLPEGVALLHQTPGEGRVDLAQARIRVSDGQGLAVFFSPAPIFECAEGALPAEFDAVCLLLDAGAAEVVRPGGRYLVEVTLPGNRRIHGSVTLPGDFRIQQPVPGATRCRMVPNELLPIRWTVAEGARAYVPEAEIFGLKAALEAEGIGVPSDPVVLLGLSISESDTGIVFPSQFGIFNRFSSDREVLVALQRGLPALGEVEGEVVVSAQGRNSVNWNRGGNFNPSGTIRVPSLFGDGTGVVGGVVNRSFGFTTRDVAGIPPCLP
jgi:hypothetical protein